MKTIFCVTSLLFSVLLIAQPLNQKQEFTKQDSLRGSNNDYRNWWDVKHYNIRITPNFDEKEISGKVHITFEVVKNVNNPIMQIDLQQPLFSSYLTMEKLNDENGNVINKKLRLAKFSSNLNIKDISENSNISRDGNLYLVQLNGSFQKGERYSTTLTYNGNPKIAKNPPWDGGWIFKKDEKGRPWMSAAVQGLGASAWYPNKDYQGDEPNEGAILSITVPVGMTAIGNGKSYEIPTGYQVDENGKEFGTYTWEVKNPINNYNIIPYIGSYVNFKDTYEGLNGTLDLDYYVLDYNLEKAKKQFEQVKPMLKCFEDWFGAYPFYEDSFKLVESPYLGMEHQSNIAYGNQYINGYVGSDLSRTGHGLKWDFIIIHESGHEWFGNNITTKDIADMWVHEGFTHYSEVIYTQCQSGLKAGNEYAQGLFKNVVNDIPIIGHYGVNQEGSGDMYAKGAALIHTLRQLMEDDAKFKRMLRDMNKTFYHQTVTTKQIEDFISKYSGKDLTAFFNQYLRTTHPPILEIEKTEKGKTKYRYKNVVDGFDMPIKLVSGKWIFPTTEWKTYKKKDKFKLDPNFYVLVEKK